MSDVIGRGVIEVSADSTKLKAGLEEAKRSLAGLGIAASNVTKGTSASIDKYVRALGIQSQTIGKSAREAELLKLGLRGATEAQLKAADAALRMTERHKQWVTIGQEARRGLLMLGAAAATGFIAAAVALDHLVKKAGDFQDMAEKIGDTSENIASLAVSAAVGGVGMEAVVGASAKLSKALTGVDDDSKAAGAAISALGLDLGKFKQLAPADQFETIAKALAGFEDGTQKTAVVMALFGKAGAEMLPFLKELGAEGGRQVILTEEQIRKADEYSDAQKRLHAQISLYASAIATDMIPAYNDLSGAFLDLLKGIAGVETGSKDLKNSTAIQDFANSASRSLAFLIDMFDGVARSFLVVGKSIGGWEAAKSFLLQGEIKLAVAALAEADADIQKTLARPTMGSLLEARIAEREAKAASGFGFTKAPPGSRPKLDFEGAQKKDSGKAAAAAAAEAKAQLTYDIDQIKQRSEATIGAYANAEKIMEARRAANLIDEKQYYASKLGFLNINSQAQEAAIQQEIERLQREQLVGKDKIENDRKIADAQARLAKVRADAVASIEINGIQEAAANKKIAQSYIDATEAAQAYIDTINKQNAREIAGIGRGAKFRADQAGIGVIEDKQTTSRQGLEGDLRRGQIDRDTFDRYLAVVNDTYTKEIAAYTERTKAINASQAEWSNGASEALRNYYDESQNIAKQTEDLFTRAFQNMEDALVNFTQTGKMDFKSLANSIIADITRIAIKQSILAPLSKAMGENAGGFSSLLGNLFGASTQAAAPVADAFFKASGGSVTAGTPYMVGERGPELFIPSSSGNIMPNGAGVTVTNVFHITGATDRRSQAQIAAAAGQGVQRAMARNN